MPLSLSIFHLMVVHILLCLLLYLVHCAVYPDHCYSMVRFLSLHPLELLFPPTQNKQISLPQIIRTQSRRQITSITIFPLCNTPTHDTHHLFNCTHIRTTLSPLDLWADPAGVMELVCFVGLFHIGNWIFWLVMA